ncbi:MAG: NAD(P)/FAD-dependent oxidoreductase [Coriobacteriia bacterium]|nr:NAD(P)/FAD-dependent oxidoreductase [Coriobacteriia bacterium]
MTEATTACTQPTVAIIGYGTAGVNALIGLRNAGFTGRVQVFSNIDTLPYSPILTSYYAGGEKTYEECFPWTAAELDDLHPEVVRATVTNLDVDARTVTTAEGAVYPYTKCVIATGARPMCYGFPADCGYSPLVLRTMADAQRMKDAFENPACKNVLVSGASMVALKSLEAALNCGKQVTLVGMNPHVLDFNALPETAERFEAGLRAKGVTLKLGCTIKTVEVVEAPEGRLKVGFADGSTGYFDEISVSHGMRCNLDFVPEGALELDRALVVDDFMRTSNPHVYAAGDVAQALELVSGNKRIVGIWKTAAVQGYCAGTAIAAELAGAQPSPAAAYEGAIPTNTIAVNGTLFISAGTMDVTENRTVDVRETDDMTVVYVFETAADGTRRLAGFNLTCDTDEEGSVAYDTGAMLTMRIESAFAR